METKESGRSRGSRVEDYYRKELCKLLAIATAEVDSGHPQIGTEYIREKCLMALNGIGIGIHPILSEPVEQFDEAFKERSAKWRVSKEG